VGVVDEVVVRLEGRETIKNLGARGNSAIWYLKRNAPGTVNGGVTAKVS